MANEIEERFVLEIKVPIANSNTVETYTTQLTKNIVRLEGPYDEGYVEIPIDVFHDIVKWVNKKVSTECQTCGADK